MAKIKTDEILGTDIYAITAEEYSRGRDNIEVVKEMLDGGIKLIQYREKKKPAGEKLEQCKKIRKLTKEAGCKFIVNDDVDIAMLVGADGIHVGQDDLPVNEIRKLVGEEMLIGLSTHSPKQAKEAASSGADYIGVGPVFKTNTKEDVVEPVGLSYVDYVYKNMDIPFVAIGGIKKHNIQEVMEKGAYCFAMVTEIVEADDIPDRIEKIRELLHQ
ncbi:Thiamine-phosphate synthase [Natranaerofaba carboxydovora]|nr:thiamine phosphate synthase [Natranaerofaba carboxydovora]UMZ73178.1 Thiamine-phosphate synthase [Natranaerofaba carboxydovora]